MNWFQKHKTKLGVFGALFFALILTVSCTLDIGTEPGDVGGMSCDKLKSAHADGEELTQVIATTGKSFLSHIEEHIEAEGSRMGQWFIRLLLWRHGGDREAAEKTVADGHLEHMAALENEIAARCT